MSAAWLGRRLFLTLAMAWVVATIVFLALHMVPGDPAELLLSTSGAMPDPATVQELREKLGLDQPLMVQYGRFLAGLVRGDLGTSLVDDYPVIQEIALRLPRTLELILAGTLIAVVIGVPAGVYAAVHRGGAFDRVASWVTALLLAVPVFVVGTLLILLLAQTLRLMPAGGFVPFAQDPGQHLKLLTLPAIAIGKGLAAVLFRMARASTLDALREDFVRTARAKGLSQRQVLWGHVLRNAMIPVLTIMGLQFAFLISGTVVVEQVFVLPGVGRLVFQAIANRDLVVVRDVVLLLVAMVVFVNFVVDVLYAVIDPRLKPSDA